MSTVAANFTDWSMKTAIEQITRCGFSCEAGTIENNAAWQWLVGAAKVGPEFWPGQRVWFKITAEAAGKQLSSWVNFYIVGCRMTSSDRASYFVYDLSWDPPSPYHYGVVHFTYIDGSNLRLSDPTKDGAS